MSSTEIRASHVEAVDVTWDDCQEKKNTIEDEIGVQSTYHQHCYWREQDVDDG